MLDNPIAWAALICFLLGLALSGLFRLVYVAALGSLVPPVVFLSSYVLTYQQIPPFPPVGATNKIFYITLAGCAPTIAEETEGSNYKYFSIGAARDAK
jgi:hypothetical protein